MVVLTGEEGAQRHRTVEKEVSKPDPWWRGVVLLLVGVSSCSNQSGRGRACPW